MVTLHEVITFLVSMQISISSLQTHNVNRCGRSRHLARKLSLRRKRSSPNVFEIQGDVLATDNNTVGMGDAGIKSAIQGSNVPNPDEAVPSFVSGAMAKAGKGLLEGTLQ